MIINEYKRLAATWRRFAFEFSKSMGVFCIIKKIPWLKLKEPWNTLYRRSKL